MKDSFDLLAELFARDIDRELLQRSCAKTPAERLTWLEEMQAFAASIKQTSTPGERR